MFFAKPTQNVYFKNPNKLLTVDRPTIMPCGFLKYSDSLKDTRHS